MLYYLSEYNTSRHVRNKNIITNFKGHYGERALKRDAKTGIPPAIAVDSEFSGDQPGRIDAKRNPTAKDKGPHRPWGQGVGVVVNRYIKNICLH